MRRLLPNRRAGREPGHRRGGQPLAQRRAAVSGGVRIHARPPAAPARADHRRPQPVPSRDRAVDRRRHERGQALADIATITILQHHASLEAQVLNDQLTQALQSRIVIEQAKGVLAEAAHLGMGDAFERLRGYARSHNLRLTEVAQAVVDRRLSPDLDRPLR